MDLELSAEARGFVERVERFARERVAPAAAGLDETAAFPRELFREAAGLGLAGVTIPVVHGGAGQDYVAYALAIEVIARASATLAVSLAAHNSLVAEPLLEFGTDAQKETWLRPLATGALIGAFALSEERAGSDAAHQKTVARLDATAYVLNGRKVWVANGEVADLVLVSAASQPASDGREVSAFLVPADSPGLSRGPVIDSLGVRGLGCVDLRLDDVHVGADGLLGAPGQGFRVAMWALEGCRIAIAAQALGIGHAAVDEALAHARAREQFGQPIANFQAIQFMLADMATELEAARMLTLKAADAKTRQPRVLLEASMAKLLASEAAHAAANRALQILGAAGYKRGHLAERLFRDARVTEIYPGTSEVQRMVIAEMILGKR
jgi:alkylation response protein AidB-like acyl-CoA dehydrogenase